MPDTGDVYIDDVSTREKKHLLEIRKKVGIVFQNADNQIVSPSIYEDVSFGPQNLGMTGIEKIVDNALESVDLLEYKEGLTANLSGGEKQRLAIAGILAMNPKYLVLDEATAMLDKASSKQVLEIVNKLNKENKITIIHITHNVEEAILANRVIIMDKGKIILDDKPLEIFKNISFLKELNIEIPVIMQLMHELRAEGIDINPDTYTIAGAKEEIMKKRK